MARILSFASWNVEHFKNDAARVDRCVAFIQSLPRLPDIFGIFEVEGAAVFEAMVAAFPTHNFYLTEGLQVQETLVAVRKPLTCFITQRHVFKEKTPTLRPGTLATIHLNGTNYSFLFLHLKSLTDPRGWGLRTNMIEHALKLKKALDKRAPGNGAANFVALGDFNTMGLNVRDGDNDIDGAAEIERMRRRFRRVDMNIAAKDADVTWWGGGATPPSNLDHIVASDHLDVRGHNQAQVSVFGWPTLNTVAQRRTWINRHSDHGLLYAELHG